MIKKYINDEIKLEKYQLIGIISLVVVISGLFGWIYEFVFYYFNFGMNKFYWQGGNFLPWINIYAIGSLMILLLTKRLKKHPILVFFVSFISTGILEYISGFLVLKIRGVRYWDYNTEILNFGNIDGFVCLRSVLFFGFSALILIYLIMPFCIYLANILNKKTFLIISISLLSIVLLDEFYNLFIAHVLSLPRARDIYSNIGINYMTYHKNT